MFKIAIPEPALVAVPAAIEPATVSGTVACQILGGINARTLYNWRMRHGLPFVETGGKIQFIPESLRNWAKDRERVISPDSGTVQVQSENAGGLTSPSVPLIERRDPTAAKTKGRTKC